MMNNSFDSMDQEEGSMNGNMGSLDETGSEEEGSIGEQPEGSQEETSEEQGSFNGPSFDNGNGGQASVDEGASTDEGENTSAEDSNSLDSNNSVVRNKFATSSHGHRVSPKTSHSASQKSSHSASHSASSTPKKAEEGDYIINWHLQYIANIFLQYSAQLLNLQDQIKAELIKIKTDGDFIKTQLAGPHHNLVQLKNEDRDLRSALEPITDLNNLFRLIANRAANRLL
jgi:hypothetical protein